MKSYLSEIFMALAGISLLLVFSPYLSSTINIEYSLVDSLVSDLKEVPKYFIFSSFTPALLIVMIFSIIIIRNLGLISRRKYAQYCYAISALTVIIVLVGFFRFDRLSWIVISLPPMFIGSYLAGSKFNSVVKRFDP